MCHTTESKSVYIFREKKKVTKPLLVLVISVFLCVSKMNGPLTSLLFELLGSWCDFLCNTWLHRVVRGWIFKHGHEQSDYINDFGIIRPYRLDNILAQFSDICTLFSHTRMVDTCHESYLRCDSGILLAHVERHVERTSLVRCLLRTHQREIPFEYIILIWLSFATLSYCSYFPSSQSFASCYVLKCSIFVLSFLVILWVCVCVCEMWDSFMLIVHLNYAHSWCMITLYVIQNDSDSVMSRHNRQLSKWSLLLTPSLTHSSVYSLSFSSTKTWVCNNNVHLVFIISETGLK